MPSSNQQPWAAAHARPGPARRPPALPGGCRPSGVVLRVFAGQAEHLADIPVVMVVVEDRLVERTAAALDGPTLVPSALSIWPIAARMVHDMPGQYLAADCRNKSR